MWFCLLSCLLVADPPASPGYFRQPTIHANTVIFTAEGDLWTVDAAGGRASRLTSHPGQENFAAISPDGKQVAFSAEYEGPTEVYVMSVAGGLPRRLTWDGDTARVIGWRDNEHVVYTTQKFATLPNNQLVVVHTDSFAQQLVPLAQAADGTWDEDDCLFFTRFHKQGSSTKRYRGGTAENIWKFPAGGKEAEPLTADYPGTSREPFVHDGRVYFASDRDGTMNVWSMTPDGKDLKQHTAHTGFDVLGLSQQGGRIVYQLGADLRLLDLKTGNDSAIPITLPSDFDQRREKWIRSPMTYLTSTDISPDGDRIVLTTRGQVFVSPAKTGRRVRITHAPGVRFRGATFAPDGKHLLLLSDESGEFEFWKVPANGLGDRKQLTDNGDILRFSPTVSPDGKSLAWFDKNHDLWLLDISSGDTRKLATSQHFNFSDLTFSPDSRWLAYVQKEPNLMSRIMVYDLQKNESHAVTTDRADSFSPAWSPDGKWLYFLSDRNLYSLVRSPWGARQPEPFFANTTQIFEIALTEGQRSPFAPADEFASEENGQKDATEKPAPETNTNAQPQPTQDSVSQKSTDAVAADDSKNDTEPDSPETKPAEEKSDAVVVNIDFNNIISRTRRVPVTPGRYHGLAATRSHLLWISVDNSKEAHKRLQRVAIKSEPKDIDTLVSRIKSYGLSFDHKKVLVHKENQLHVFAPDGKIPDLSRTRVSLSDLSFSVQPPEEWKQMLVDAWRMERDYFYDRELHGTDWNEVLQRHMALVDRVTDRDELNDLIAQMVGELEALHTYVRGGDVRSGADQIRPGSLGASLLRDPEQGGYVVKHVFQSDPDYPDSLAPLLRMQPPVKTDDVILSVNGQSALDSPHINTLLRNTSGKQVALRIRDSQSGTERNAIVVPISQSSEADLRYREWEYTRRLQVDEQSDNQVGYVHLRAMGGDNIAEWTREFYPVFHKQGLIIDVRHNRGGNIDSWILEKLLRQAWFYWKPRVGEPYWNMQYAFRGHMVVLCNERTASDGEAFCEGFRRMKLGKVLGVRTWGGEIWLSYNNRLVDKGYASAAQTGVYADGEWLIEGHGVEPDIVVDNLPHATFQGKDAQLEKAIKHLQRLIKRKPNPVPEPPAYPRRNN